MGSIVLTSLLAAAWLLVLIVVLLVLLVVAVVLVRFLLVATVAVSTWAERNGADPRTYWWPWKPGERRQPRQRPEHGRPTPARDAAPAGGAAPGPMGRRTPEPEPAGAHERSEHGVLAGIRSRFQGEHQPAERPRPEPVRPEQLRPEQPRPEPFRPEPPRQEVRPDQVRPEPAAPPAMAPAPAVAASELPPPGARREPAPQPARPPVAAARPAPRPDEDDRESAMDRLFAPLADSDRTEPLPAVRPRTPRTPRQPRP